MRARRSAEQCPSGARAAAPPGRASPLAQKPRPPAESRTHPPTRPGPHPLFVFARVGPRPPPAPHQPSRVVKRCHLFELASGGGGPSSGWGMFHDLEGHQGIGPTVVLPPIRACRLVLLTICHLALPPPAPPAHLEWNNSSPIQRSSGERSDVTARRTRVVIARAHVRGRAIMTGLERLCFTM